MDFEIYCDESGLEALTQKNAHQYTAIGGIWMPSTYRPEFKKKMLEIKENNEAHNEFKWQKVSPSYLEVYEDLVEYFFTTEELRFRVILIESETVDNINFNNKDAELGFYKFYYQLLHHWISDFNRYNIFLDYKVNRNKGRLNELKNVLNASNITSEVSQVQALHSNESLGIQLADVLTGIVFAKFNKVVKSNAKLSLIGLAESHIGKEIAPTGRWEDKFNVFCINLLGGW